MKRQDGLETAHALDGDTNMLVLMLMDKRGNRWPEEGGCLICEDPGVTPPRGMTCIGFTASRHSRMWAIDLRQEGRMMIREWQ